MFLQIPCHVYLKHRQPAERRHSAKALGFADLQDLNDHQWHPGVTDWRRSLSALTLSGDRLLHLGQIATNHYSPLSV